MKSFFFSVPDKTLFPGMCITHIMNGCVLFECYFQIDKKEELKMVAITFAETIFAQ